MRPQHFAILAVVVVAMVVAAVVVAVMLAVVVVYLGMILCLEIVQFLCLLKRPTVPRTYHIS